MTPYEITTLIEIYVSPDEPESCPALNDALADFQAKGLIETCSYGRGYKITERGEAHILQMQNLPIPVKTFIDYEGKPIEFA